MKKIILFLFISLVALFGNSLETQIPDRAKIYFPEVIKASNEIFPEFILPSYFGALIEHESCITLKHSRCWSPTSELKTSREQGVGLGQLTRAWTKTGSLRFDSLGDIRKKHYNELKELSWSNIKQRPDLQIKAIILMWKDNYVRLPSSISDYERIAMADAAYNGGYGDLLKERKYCGLKKDCDPNYWFGNIEKTCLKSTRKLYGNRSACDINRHHVHDVMEVRLNKYIYYWFKIE